MIRAIAGAASVGTDGIEIVFETHSLTEDNERGVATGWDPGRLSEPGRALALELGRRRSGDGITAVFSSDLQRSVETVMLTFGGGEIPILFDWRLRECDYGLDNGTPVSQFGDRLDHLDDPYPGGESSPRTNSLRATSDGKEVGSTGSWTRDNSPHNDDQPRARIERRLVAALPTWCRYVRRLRFAGPDS